MTHVTLTPEQVKTLNRIRLRGIVGELIVEEMGDDVQVTYASTSGELVVATVTADGSTIRIDRPL